MKNLIKSIAIIAFVAIFAISFAVSCGNDDPKPTGCQCGGNADNCQCTECGCEGCVEENTGCECTAETCSPETCECDDPCECFQISYGGFLWMLIDDKKETNNGLPSGTPIGKSDIFFGPEEYTEEGSRIFSVSGNLKTGFYYPFALLSAQAEEDELEALQTAIQIKFWIQGDGQSVDVKLPQDNLKGPMEGGTGDSSYYYSRVQTSSTAKLVTLNIPGHGNVSSFAQPTDWGTTTSYDQTTLEQINFQTTGGAGSTFSFKVWGLELITP